MLPVVALLLWSFVDVFRKEGRKESLFWVGCLLLVVVVVVVVVLSFEKGECLKS
jgi:predicted PurR-regulated permease PerM